MSTTTDASGVLRNIGSVLDLVARTQRGVVGEVATILAGAANVASALFGSGKSAEEIRAMVEDLAANPPQAASQSGASSAVDKIIEERKKSGGLPPKAP